jgi:tRNA-dihydrouridine synthase A
MLPEFVETLIKSDVSTFIIHARKAMLEGLDPKQNREIPPLDYDMVRMIKRKWPDLNIILNGGLLTPYSAKNEISASKGIELDGVMIGRAVLENPYSIIDVDKIFYNDNKLMPSRFKIAEEMIHYLEESVQKGVPINIITQNMLGLFHGCRGAKIWRSYLSHEAPRRRDDPKVLSEAINLVFEAQNEAA